MDAYPSDVPKKIVEATERGGRNRAKTSGSGEYGRSSVERYVGAAREVGPSP